MRGGAWLLTAATLVVSPLALATGCDCTGDRGPEGNPDGSVPLDAAVLDGLQSLRIDPMDATLVVEGATPATQQYRAFGTFEDGVEREITDAVTFRTPTTPPNVGTFSGSLFTSSITNGGRIRIEARAGSQIAIGRLAVVLRRSVAVAPTGGAPALPANPGGLFGGTDDPSRAPTLVYPNDGVVLPPNLGRVEVHWLRGPATNTLFEVAFENEVTDVRAYVRCERPERVRDDGCIWEPAGETWTWIAETNRGGAPLRVRVRATDDSGSAVGSSDDIELQFARDPLRGTIYYWTTSPGAIMRFDFGAPAGEAELVMGPGQTQSGQCVGCHAISRDGTKLVGSVGGQNGGGVLMYDLEEYQPIWNESAADDHVLQFSSFSPDGDTLVGVYGDDTYNGAENPGPLGMFLFDVTCEPGSACGTPIGTIANGGREVSHPAWAPRSGQWIAFTDVGDPAGTSQRPRHGAIGIVSREGSGWSGPSELVPRLPGISRYNPDWSPDDDESFLVFNESTCPGGDVAHADCNADSDPSAKIWAVIRETGATVRLDQLGTPGVMDEGRTDLNNTFPRMAPFVFVLDSGEFGTRELMYVSFASTRAYGLRTAPGGNDESGGRGTYIWMAGVLPDDLANGDDGSFPAFALPFQETETSNHIAVWTTESIGDPGPI